MVPATSASTSTSMTLASTVVGSQPRPAALECVPVHVVGRRKGGHVYGERIRPLLEQQRQILVPYLPQREPHSDGVLPIAQHRRLGRAKRVRVHDVREAEDEPSLRRILSSWFLPACALLPPSGA